MDTIGAGLKREHTDGRFTVQSVLGGPTKPWVLYLMPMSHHLALRLFSILLILPILPTALCGQQEPLPAPVLEALELIDQGDLAAAISNLESLRADGEAPLPALAALGALYLETGRPQMALEILRPLADAVDADPAVLYNAGRAAAGLGQIEQAGRYLSRSAQAAPNSPAGRELGMLMAQTGYDEQAYVHLRPWAMQNPDDVEARLAAAMIAVRLERVPDAERLLSDLSQDNPGVRLLWGQVLLVKGDPWGALGYLKPLLADAPAAMENDLRRSLAKAYLAVGEASAAIEALEGQVGEDPSTALQLGRAYYQGGDLERALATLEPFALALLDEDPQTATEVHLGVTLEYGRLLLTAGQRSEALPYLRLATRQAPENKQAWQALGQALAMAGEREEAQVAMTRFQELGKQQPPESVNRRERELRDPTGTVIEDALEHLQNDETDEALEMLSREAALTPEDPRPPLLASRILLLKDELEQALGAVDLSLSIDPQNPDAHYQRGVVLLALKRLEEAETELRTALEMAPNHTAAMSDLAVLLANTERADEARELLQRVLELRPEDTMARQNLERLENRSNRR